MTFLFLVLASLLVGGVLVFVLWPLWGAHTPTTIEVLPNTQWSDVSEFAIDTSSTRAALLARREALYAALRDIAFDHALGKLAEGDYQILHRQLTLEAAQVLHQLDHLAPETAVRDQAIEQAVTHLRGSEGALLSSLPANVKEAVEAEIALLIKHTTGSKESDELLCPNCGQSFQPEDLFCVHCGARLEQRDNRSAT